MKQQLVSIKCPLIRESGISNSYCTRKGLWLWSARMKLDTPDPQMIQ
jgi:hypothetical protein